MADDTDAQIGSAVGAVSNGDDVALVLEGANLTVFANGVSIGSTSTIRHLTGTGAYFYDFAGGFKCDSIEFFPRDVTTLLPAALV